MIRFIFVDSNFKIKVYEQNLTFVLINENNACHVATKETNYVGEKYLGMTPDQVESDA